MTDTIFAPATSMGKAGVAVVRISGEAARDSIAYFGITQLPKPREATLAHLYHPETGHILDQALLLWFPAPHSFTGEDVVEFHVHGSRVVVDCIMELLGRCVGCRVAEAGEFSKRAFLNGKMDLTQIEGLADLIDASTEAQRKQAMQQLQGSLGKLYEQWRAQLVRILAYIEAYIDFPDEPLPDDLVVDITHQIDDLKGAIHQHLDDNHRGERIRDGVNIVILGAPNVGKSSLLNYLSKRDVAIVSDIAGTTRDIIEVPLDIAGIPVKFIDTAGLRKATDRIESIGIAKAREHAAHADITLVMLEASSWQQGVEECSEWIDERSLVVVNKADILDDAASCPYLCISVVAEKNMERLLQQIEERIQSYISSSEHPTITRTRHRMHLEESYQALSRLSLAEDIILAAEELRTAMHGVGAITGKVEVEELLDTIFKQFCIGK